MRPADSYRRIRPIIIKEFRQIRRDKRSLGVLLILPAALVLMIGYAMNFDVKHIKVAVFDQEKTAQSRELIDYFAHSEYFDPGFRVNSYAEIQRLLDRGDAGMALVIPEDYSRLLAVRHAAPIQVLIDGSNANNATTIVGYVAGFVASYTQSLNLTALQRNGIAQYVPLEIRPIIWYNPELISSRFLVPGMVGFILMITGVVSTSLSIVREKERGTMEQLMISPLRTFEIILGKTLPYLIIALLSSTLVVTFGFLLFDVQIRGNVMWLYGSIFLYLLCALGQGILISTFSNNQQVAFMVSIFTSLLPTFLLSGFVFPIRSMPLVLQILSNAAPAKFFLIITRAVVLKGVGIAAFWEQLLYLILFAVITIALSSVRLMRKAA